MKYVESVDMLRDIVNTSSKKPIFIGAEAKIDSRELKLRLQRQGYGGQAAYTESKNVDKTQQELLIAFINRHRCLPNANDVIKFDAEITKDTIGFVFVITGRKKTTAKEEKPVPIQDTEAQRDGKVARDDSRQKQKSVKTAKTVKKTKSEDPEQREWERSTEGRKFILEHPGPPLCLLDVSKK